MTASQSPRSDALIWLAAAAISIMAAAWLFIEAPWSRAPSTADLQGRSESTPRNAASIGSMSPDNTAPAVDSLYLAQLAQEAGMLLEPANSGAWQLFGRIADENPGNASAQQGLQEVAAGLIDRGRAALEQSRNDDALALAETIIARLPEHPAAQQLLQDTRIAMTPPEPVAVPAPTADPAPQAEPEPDPIPDLNARFHAAMAANALLSPANDNAAESVRQMLEHAPEHELTVAAQNLLVTEMLDRSTQAIEALDTAAARTWIDSAATLTADDDRIAVANARLDTHLIALESQRVRPITELTKRADAVPEYPELALKRGVEGWVEVEFTVTAAGDTADIRVIDASHPVYFRDEAVAAIAQWQYEPAAYLGQAVAARTLTRLVFQLN